MNPVKNHSNPLSLNQVGIHSPYWEPYRKLVKAVVLPYQWEVLNDRIPEAEPSRVIKNLRISAGLEEGERGKEPYFYTMEWEKRDRTTYWENTISKAPEEIREYNQTHLPVREQKKAVGHAVRLVYMLNGMADVAMETSDGEMLEVCRALWENITQKQMYITGGIGAFPGVRYASESAHIQ